MFPVMFSIPSLHGAKIPCLALGPLPVHSSLCPSGQSLTRQGPADGWSLGFRSRLALRPAEHWPCHSAMWAWHPGACSVDPEFGEHQGGGSAQMPHHSRKHPLDSCFQGGWFHHLDLSLRKMGAWFVNLPMGIGQTLSFGQEILGSHILRRVRARGLPLTGPVHPASTGHLPLISEKLFASCL